MVVFATGYREAWSKLFDAKAAEVLDPRKDGPAARLLTSKLSF